MNDLKSEKTESSSLRYWFTALGTFIPLLALLFTAWKYVDEVSRENRLDERARVLTAQSALFEAIGSPNTSGTTQIFAVRQLRDSQEYCDTVIRVLASTYCGLDQGRTPNQYQHLTIDGRDHSNLAIELTLSLSNLCTTCPEHPTTVGICQAQQSEMHTERCSFE